MAAYILGLLLEQIIKLIKIFIDNPILSPIFTAIKMKGTRMTDMSKYKNVSLTKETYAILDKLSRYYYLILKLSVAKTIESL